MQCCILNVGLSWWYSMWCFSVMQGGPHPGMRHAADMSKQQSKTGGGRGGIMGMVLPVYAVGIIGYLIYTLVKVPLHDICLFQRFSIFS